MDAATSLGYDQKSWDCWQNHFEAYRYIDLGSEGIQVLQWMDDLGVTYAYWNGYGDAPASEETLWWDLTTEERYAAAQLCFFRRSWNEMDYYYNNMFPMLKPKFRFVEWTSLDESTRSIAEQSMKYSKLSWNVIGLDPIESRAWCVGCMHLLDLSCVQTIMNLHQMFFYSCFLQQVSIKRV